MPSELISVVLIYWLSSAGTGVWPLHKEPHTLELSQAKGRPFCRTYKHYQKKQVCAWCVLVSKWMSWNALTLTAPGELVSQAQIKQSPTIKRIPREEDQSSGDLTFYLKINYLLVIWLICLLSVCLEFTLFFSAWWTQKGLLGKLTVTPLKRWNMQTVKLFKQNLTLIILSPWVYTVLNIKHASVNCLF